MTISVQLPLGVRLHNNQQLFSDHYLDVTLPKRADWRALAAQVEPVMKEIAGIFDRFQPSNNEAQTEESLIRPILKALGHTYEVQASLKTPDGTKTPDYVFYVDGAALTANKGKVLTDELPKQGAFAVGDAKYWDRPLDQTIKGGTGDPFTNKNPSYQIAFYIQHSGLDWGILTNGRKWRLYHKATAHKLDRFYEADLKELLDLGDPGLFLYFYAFFNRAAFETHPLGIAAILQESADYARGVGNTLKTHVYEALRHLAQGFLDYAPNGLPSDPATLKQIYDASLIVLYRMLFILYSEARELLPLYESPQYRSNYSFKSIKESVAHDLKAGVPLLHDSATLWPRLKTLFGIINAGSPPLKVATFNGGLFDPNKHPFLEQYTVGDAHLQQAIDKLARVDHQSVDYRDLAVRHLGTIYEGLLEYHLVPLEEPEDGWTVALLNDKGERKATGSYYTPDYIVKYIVEQTLGPVLDSAARGAKGEAAKVDAILSTNVLDPAMGSGHFLVEATEYIARYLVELAVHPPGSNGDEPDLAYWKRRVAHSCVYGVDLNPLAVELAKLSLWLSTVEKDRPLSFLDHHLRAGNSLIGARIADLRLNTQLTAAQKRARKQERDLVESGYLSMLEDDAFRRAMSIAVGSMWLIEENPGLTVEQVKEQEQVYGRLRETLTRKYGRLADLVTATHFGLKVDVDPQQWQALADYATGKTPIAAMPQFAQWLEEADATAEQRRFFHWELEFPEVFFDRNGQPLGDAAGFDGVIGNPPYFLLQGHELQKPLSELYPEIYSGSNDVSHFFLARGAELLGTERALGFIVTRYWIEAHLSGGLRSYLTSYVHPTRIIDFGNLQVWPDVNVLAVVCFFRKSPTNKVEVYLADEDRFSTALGFYEEIRDAHYEPIIVESSFFTSGPWHLRSIKSSLVWSKVSVNSIALDHITRNTQGIKTGNNDVFTVSPRTVQDLGLERDALIPVAQAQYVRRYQLVVGEFAIYTDGTFDIDGKPRIKAYLSRFEEQLSKRAECNHGLYPWWRLQRPRDREIMLHGERILVPLYATENRFSYSKDVVVGMTDVYIITPKDEHYNLAFLSAILNSQLLNAYHQTFCKVKRAGYLEYSGSAISALPIRCINFTISPDRRMALAEKGHKLYEQCISEQSHQYVLGFVDHHLSQEPEESDVVHDLLAYLAQQMIDLNKQRQQALEDFMLDLEGVLPSADLKKIGRLWTPPKGEPPIEAQAQLGSLASERLELRDDIGRINEEQWKWLLRGRLKKIDSLAKLVRVYRNRQPAIAALDARIAFTDGLIDAVVYRLYGLTEDEVAIVEGSVAK